MSDDMIKNAVDGLASAFEEFKATNDERLKQVEEKGSADPLVEEKLVRIEADLGKYEDFNQKLVTQSKAAEGFNSNQPCSVCC